MGHAGKDDVRIDGADEANDLGPCLADPLAFEAMDLDPRRRWLRSGSVGGDDAQVDGEALGIEMLRQLRDDPLRAASTEVRNHEQ